MALAAVGAAPASAKTAPRFTTPLFIPEVLTNEVRGPTRRLRWLCGRHLKTANRRRCFARARRAAGERCVSPECYPAHLARERRARAKFRRASRRCKRSHPRRAARRRCLRRALRPRVRRGPVGTAPITLEMKAAGVPILPGAPTEMWTFNGTFPGPTIKAKSGSPLQLRVVNHLPPGAGAMTIHNHGGHQPSSEDGRPADFLIPEGGERTYDYPLVEDGEPERGAFQWYHDHSDHRTARNVYNGLAGMFILEDDFERALPLPKDKYDVPLMVNDRSFNDDNSLNNPFREVKTDPVSGQIEDGNPPNDETVGDQVLVNGRPQPYFDVAARKYRFRILNAAHFALYNFHLSNDQEMVQVATESGLLPRPVARKKILLGPGERAEVVVDFSDLKGQEVALESVPRDDPNADNGTASRDTAVMQFRVNRDAPDPSSVPETLRPAPPVDLAGATERTWNWGLGYDAETQRPAWTINGQTFDPERVDAFPKLGSTEVWTYVNSSTVTHYIHNHDVDFRLLSRDGRPPDPSEDGLKETFKVDPGERVRIAAKFPDHLGRFMLHCHMLDHEDHGMMTQFEVVGPNGERAPAAAAHAHAGPGIHGPVATWATLLRPLGGGALLLPFALLLAALASRRPLRALGARVRRDSAPTGTVAARHLGAGLLILVAWGHLVAFPHKLEAPYMAVLFTGSVVACAVLAWLLASGRRTGWAWGASGTLCAGILAGYVASRSVGLPGVEHDIANWLDPIGASSALFAAAAAILALAVLAPRPAPPVRRTVALAMKALPLLIVLLLLTAVA